MSPSTDRPCARIQSARSSEIHTVNPLEDPNWDEKVAALPGAGFFHGATWARVLFDTYGFIPTYLVAGTSARFDALLPVMEVNSWLTGRRGIALPFADECGPLGEPSAANRLIDHLGLLARARRWKYWEVRGKVPGSSPPASLVFHRHRADLQGASQGMLGRCAEATRRAVRKALKSGLTIEFSQDLANVRAFYSLVCKTRQRHGLPPQGFHFFANIQRHVLARRLGCLVLACLNGVPAAGAIYLHFGRSAIFKFGASDPCYQHLRPNNLVMWRALEWHARAGFESMDFGRTSIHQEGLRQYKLGWGTTESELQYVRFDCRRSAFVTAPDHSAGWHSALFKHVPRPLARLVGTAIYKHAA